MTRLFAITWCAGAVFAPAAAGQGHELYRIPNTSHINCRFGDVIERLGDLDGDGRDDFAIADYGESTFISWEGVVTVHSGRDGAVIREHRGGAHNDQYGRGVASLADRDGDGVRDYAVYGGDPVIGRRVDFFSGASGSLLWTWSVTAQITTMENAGDLDGDGVEDLLFDGAGNNLSGRVFALSGATQAELWSIWGEGSQDNFGDEMVVVDDMDGDGIKELLVGAPDRPKAKMIGALYLYSMATQQLRWKVEGDSTRDFFFGQEISVAGDVDGDGTTDFTAHRGGRASWKTTDVFSGVDGSVLASLVAPGANEELGAGACEPFDVDGDGDLDLLIGGSKFDASGNSTHLLYAWEPRDRVFFARVEHGPTAYPTPQRFATLGDIDGDGFLDFLWMLQCQDAVVRTLRSVPVVEAIAPDRMQRDTPTAITIHGSGFALAQQLAVRVGGVDLTDAVALDDATITATAPAGEAGLFDVEVAHDAGSSRLAEALARTPAVRVSGAFGPGDTFTIHWLCEVGDDLLAIFGAPPAVALATPPYEGLLRIAPFDVLFIVAASAGDEVTIDVEIPDDPAWIGTEALAQGLAGASLFGPGKRGSWSNAPLLRVEDS